MNGTQESTILRGGTREIKSEAKRASQRLTFLSKHVPFTQPLPFAVVFSATPQ